MSILSLACAAPARPQAAAPAAIADDPKAASLIRDATRPFQERDWEAARKKLDEAKAINPRQAYLWSNYGALALMLGKPNEAAEDFQRELAAHPDEDNVTLLLVGTQMQQHKSQEAIATLQALVVRSPNNDQANGMLTSLLLNEKQYPAAEKVLRGFLAAHPDNVQAQLLLSNALVREDKKPEATALLKSIAEKTQDPALLNDAAYALADENLDVPLAVTTARRSLAMVERSPNAKPLIQAELLVSVWDTLGWALFRAGNTAAAEPLVRAAWSNALTAEPGYHLGMILEKQGQPAKAMAVYQIAAFGDKGGNADATAASIAERQTALRKAGTPSQVPDGRNALQALRTFTVPGKNTLTGSATVELEFATTGASNATIVKDDPKQAPLTSVESSLYKIDFKAGVPAGSHATLTRRGILSCNAGNPCKFVLLSTRAALSN
ncbi:MAG: tetratricopeptide repeat protein [Acidobacteriota bacterium]|nr:tetratricopeptide repeat protein [Acidobacteriota bacterium]